MRIGSPVVGARQRAANRSILAHGGVNPALALGIDAAQANKGPGAGCRAWAKHCPDLPKSAA